MYPTHLADINISQTTSEILLTRKFKCYHYHHHDTPPPFCRWLNLQEEVKGEWPKSSSLETSFGSLAKMSCVAYSHVSFQGGGQTLSGNILTDVTLFQTHTSTNVHKFEAKRKGVGWGGQQPRRRNALPSVNGTLTPSG